MKMIKWLYLFLVFSALMLCPHTNAVTVTVTYKHTDMLGSVIAESNAQGNITSRSQYEPFGKRLGGEAAGIGYTGHLQDEDLGLTYMQARYYDPVIGRFYSNDPVGFKASNPMMFNRYAYANNNPYKFVDPNGKESIGVLIGNLLEGKSLEESAKSVHETNMVTAEAAKEALSYTPAGTIVDVVETVNEVMNGENIKDNAAGMIAGEIAGTVTEKLLDNKIGKEAAGVVGAVVGKLAGDAAKDVAAGVTESKVEAIEPEKLKQD